MMDLTQSLDTVRRRWRRLLALRAGSRALLAAALVAATAALAERWLQPSDNAVLALAVLAVVLIVAALVMLLWPLRRRPDDRQLARFIEESCPDLDDAIVTAVELQRTGPSASAFAPLVIAAAAAKLDSADLSKCVNPRDIRMAGWRTAGAAVAVVLAFALAAPLIERAWQVEASPAWRVVARYTNGGTALAERTGSAGRVLLLTSDVDRKWNDFPLNAAFVPFAQEVARYLGARPPAISTYLVADAPAGVPPRPGLSSAGNRTIAVNVDPRESSVARVTPAEFQALVTRGAGASQPRAVRLAQQTEGQQNYWRYGLMLMLAALVVEAFVGSR